MSSNTIVAALYSKLSTDTTLMALVDDVYPAPAPQGAEYPYVTYQKIDKTPDYTLTQRVSRTLLYQILVHGRFLRTAPQHTDLNTALDRIDALLNLQTLSISGETFWLCRNTGDVPDSTGQDNDYLYLTVGAQYELAVGG
jgi:hypothetical protein